MGEPSDKSDEKKKASTGKAKDCGANELPELLEGALSTKPNDGVSDGDVQETWRAWAYWKKVFLVIEDSKRPKPENYHFHSRQTSRQATKDGMAKGT